MTGKVLPFPGRPDPRLSPRNASAVRADVWRVVREYIAAREPFTTGALLRTPANVAAFSDVVDQHATELAGIVAGSLWAPTPEQWAALGELATSRGAALKMRGNDDARP